MAVWMGKDCVFDTFTILLITINFYLSGIRHSIFMAKASVGLYRQDRFLALLEAILNIFFCFGLSTKFGVNGILLSGIISTVAVPLWAHPYLVYKNVFECSVKNYYKKFVLYLLITVILSAVSFYCCSFTKSYSTCMQVFLNIVICTVIVLGANFLIFKNSVEFKYLVNLTKSIFYKFKVKFSSADA